MSIEHTAVRRYTATPATTGRCEHAEAPMWDARTGTLLFLDQLDGVVHQARFDPELRMLDLLRSYAAGSPVGAVVPNGGPSGWMLACALGFAYLDEAGTVTLLAQPEQHNPVPVRMNDGKCDTTGAFWAGSMGLDQQPGAASLFRLDPDLSATTVVSGATISNGIAWASTDRLYYIDTPTRRIDLLTIAADGSLHSREVAFELEPGIGNPDGMCIDSDGFLWIALWGGSRVRQYSVTGELRAEVAVDAPQVSSCAFGGPEGRTLFITTSQERMDAATRARFPQSGKVFCADVDASAPPAAAFGSDVRSDGEIVVMR